jgi:mannitol/fructose-specific phosphotransferase system IIA component (Ntr-type)
LVAPFTHAASPADVVQAAASLLARASGVAAGELSRLFTEALGAPGFSLGSGVAIPHVELATVPETLVAIVTTRAPVPLPSIDGQAPDVFLFVLARPDPKAHLLLLARLARLVQRPPHARSSRPSPQPACSTRSRPHGSSCGSCGG